MDDLNSRHAVIRFIRDKVDLSVFMKRSVDKADKACMKLCDMLDRDLPSAQQWTPCSERLPKAGEYIGDVARYYLVQNEYGDMLVARYTHSEYWEQIYQSKPYADEIVAWMPLPEPYKGEES